MRRSLISRRVSPIASSRPGDLRLELALLAEELGIFAQQSEQARLALEALAIELLDVLASSSISSRWRRLLELAT